MKNIILKNSATLFVLLISISTAFSQNSKHEVSMYVGGGLSTLTYETEVGKRDNVAGGNLGIGYTYFFIENFGLNTGVELALYKANAKVNQFNNVTQALVDHTDGELYDFYSLVKNYEEKQNATYIYIPLILQFQHGGKNKLYVQAGAKIGIPVAGKAKSSAAEMINKGFFYDTANWGETQEFRGFGAFANYSSEQDVDFKVAYSLSAELGMKWKLNDKLSLYTGAYVDYGLNDIVKGERNKSFTEITETSEAVVIRNNSILNSSIGYGSNTLTQKLTDKVTPISIGFKVRLALGL
ncbi:MAG: outer membrane beta-barrel protein [Prevotella sp.]|jgi:hypothetical protein|nr:outer membrane beta-barrel protein [Prevotella sp.]